MSFFEFFTNRAKSCVTLAKKLAMRMKHNYVGTEHILLALAQLEHGIASNILKLYKLDFDGLMKEVERFTGYGSDLYVAGEPALTSMVKKLFEYAHEEAQNLGHSYVGTEHVLLGLLRLNEGVAIQILEAFGVDPKEMRKDILKELDSFNLNIPPQAPPISSQAPKEPNSFSTPPKSPPIADSSKTTSSKTPALSAYGYDLTEMAKNMELDPVVGRENEIEWLTMILCRRRKNNAALIGDAGVGKTAVVEGLAMMIARGQVPELLQNKRIISLDLSLMVAGTKYRGQFEERIKAVMDEVKKNPNIILFIDELHTIVGAGAAEGAIDASNILKPALARGEIQCIGATTFSEYRKHIEKDPALERRFQRLTVKPPSIEETILILNGLKEKYERHHKVRYSTEALHAAAALSERYIHSRFLPDKAIDLIDEAGARQRMISLRQPSSLKDLDESILRAKKDKEVAIAQQDYEKAARLRDNEKNLIDDQKRVLTDWQKMKDEARIDIKEEHILEVLATTTGIPLKKLSESEHERMILMENTLKKWVIGQSKAIERCCKALIRSKADIKDIHRPIGSYLFLGPTGVGKTHLAKSIANYMFGSSDALIHVDMSEYMEKHTVARMIGSPPGYVGHEEGGQLTERVRQRPHCVVLFDEIEKAHHDVANILLQILEDGQLTDSLGRKVDFRNTIIILTSNLGSEQFANRSNLGFGAGAHEVPEEAIREGISKAANKFFRPELINRLDDQIIFLPFKKEDLHKIALLELEKLHQRCIKKFVYLEFTEQLIDFIIEKGYSPDQGARPLRRAVERHIEEPLAELILKKQPESMTRFRASLEEGIVHFSLEVMAEEENIGPPTTLLAKK